jgi:hypothetical protein
VFAPFFIIIILIIILLLSFFCQKFIRHISRRLLNGNQWHFTGMLSTMSRCADYFRNFQNGRRCHGNGQNAKIKKTTKMIIAGYSPNRNWWNFTGMLSTMRRCADYFRNFQNDHAYMNKYNYVLFKSSLAIIGC